MFPDHYRRILSSFNADECQFALTFLRTRLELLTGSSETLDQPIETLGFSEKTCQILRNVDVKTVRDAMALGAHGLRMLRGIGPRRIHEIQTKLSQLLEPGLEKWSKEKSM